MMKPLISVDGTKAMTTSYFPSGSAGEHTPRRQRQQCHQERQSEAQAKAQAITNRYNYVHMGSGGSPKRAPGENKARQTQPTTAAPTTPLMTMEAALAKARALSSPSDADVQSPTKLVERQPTLEEALARARALSSPEPSKNEPRRKLESAASVRAEILKQGTTVTAAKTTKARTFSLPPLNQTASKPAPQEQAKTMAALPSLAPPSPSSKKAPQKTTITGGNPQEKSSIPFPTGSIIRTETPPKAPPNTWQATLPDHQMDQSDLDYLKSEGYPYGLIKAMTDLKGDFAKQIWIVDNSESMTTRDGTMLADAAAATATTDSGGIARQFVQKCTRWDELQECVSSHIRLAGALRQPTSFRLLNDPGPSIGPQRFSICESAMSGNVQEEVRQGLALLQRNQPGGQTPLAKHIKEITEEVQAMRAGLVTSGKRVAVVICTDGVPTDASRDKFLDQLRKLETLPVWLVIRLCTNEPHVVDYYNELDSELKMSVDVIDDFQGEAICRLNPWLNYGLPLHRARERGFHTRVLDFLDECPLSVREQKEVCGVLFGSHKMEDCPEPDVDKPKFLAHIDSLQQEEQLQWDPITGKVAPWVDFVGNPKSKLRLRGKMKRKKTTAFFRIFGR